MRNDERLFQTIRANLTGPQLSASRDLKTCELRPIHWRLKLNHLLARDLLIAEGRLFAQCFRCFNLLAALWKVWRCVALVSHGYTHLCIVLSSGEVVEGRFIKCFWQRETLGGHRPTMHCYLVVFGQDSDEEWPVRVDVAEIYSIRGRWTI